MTKAITKTTTTIKAVLAALVLSQLLMGCSTMYFHNGGIDGPKDTEYSDWHHDGVLRLVEFSDPVDLNAKCERAGWSEIKIEQSFIQGLVRHLTWSLYDPWSAGYSCRGSGSASRIER